MSTATSPVPAATHHTVVPPEHVQSFKHTLTAMRSHYKATGAHGQAPHPYSIPTHLLHPMDSHGVLVHPGATPATVKTQVEAMATAAKTSTDNEVNNAHKAISQALNTLNSNKDLNAFHNALEQQRTALKQTADNAIDKAIDTAEKIGDAHPTVLSAVVQAVDKIATFFSGMASSVYTFFKNLAATIVNAIKSAVEWLEKAGKSLSGWASGIASAASAIVSVVGALF